MNETLKHAKEQLLEHREYYHDIALDLRTKKCPFGLDCKCCRALFPEWAEEQHRIGWQQHPCTAMSVEHVLRVIKTKLGI